MIFILIIACTGSLDNTVEFHKSVLIKFFKLFVRNNILIGIKIIEVAEAISCCVSDLSVVIADLLKNFGADTNIGMNLNADQLFAQMQEGRSYEGVLAAAVSQAERGLHDMPSVDVQSITNYETAKNLLCFEVVGTEQNAIGG